MSTSEGQPETSAPQQPDVSTSESRLANRYGAPKRRLTRRTRVIAAAAAVIAAVGAAAWMNVPSSTGTVTSKDVGFSFPAEDRVIVDFKVDKSAGSTAACAVQALNESYAVVGWKTVVLGPDAPDSSSQHLELRTDSPAVTGGVYSCWVVDGD
ncbi:DUF4307 domain-containing protein [Arthrobacter sp. zg-Y877]|uniref:DUF4307 domain-containing protein n=1 Tax=Arthrobacter sp. zg-Y877 TaxID=3049074 RepID=UPI0025A36DA3|nr:DUF4307 domain-containing protein [Arthrobacter sp. zg-Y877]MDM7990545.1 DUF4307 domain-containing protein [Arthrobacter sp. zg-Y877]